QKGAIFMRLKNSSRQFPLARMFQIIGFCLTFTLSGMSLASIGGEVADNALVVSITPAELDVIRGHDTSPYSLAAVKDGALKPIPYQFDERTESGFIYMKNNPDKAKKEDPLVGKEGFFDGNDQLIFMMKDGGARKSSSMKADGELLAEIAVDNYKGEQRYVYLVKGARLQSEDYYVRFSAQLGRVETDYYALKVDPD